MRDPSVHGPRNATSVHGRQLPTGSSEHVRKQEYVTTPLGILQGKRKCNTSPVICSFIHKEPTKTVLKFLYLNSEL